MAFDSFCQGGAYPACDKGGFWSKVFASDICPNAPMADEKENDKQMNTDEDKIKNGMNKNIDSVKTFERNHISLKIQEMTNLVKLIHSLKESYENYKMELRFLSSALMKSNLLTKQEHDLCEKYYQECKIVNPRILKLSDMPNDEYSTDIIIDNAKRELEIKAFNDTLAADRINRLANRVEYYALNFDVFAEKYRFWQARVAYLRNGNYPNPGRSGSDEYLVKTIEWACESLKDFDNLTKRPTKKSN